MNWSPVRLRITETLGLVLLFFIISAAPKLSRAAELATWLGGTGQWTDASKWDTSVPDNGSVEYDVVFGFNSNDKVTLNRNIEINNLHFLNGTIDGGSSDLTLHSTPFPPGSIWEPDSTSFGDPTMSGSGTTRIPQGGTLEIKSGGILGRPALDRRTLINAGETFLTGDGSFRGENNATIGNEGLFAILGDADVAAFSSTFINSGDLHKSSGTSTSQISWAFNNMASGAVEVRSGTLWLSGGGASSGSFATRAGTQLAFSGTHNLSGATFSNSGLIELSGTANFNQPVMIGGNVELFGTLGGGGVVTLERLSWAEGRMTNSGTTRITGVLNMVQDFGRFEGALEGGRILSNAGMATLERDGTLAGNNGATFVNEAGGTFTVQQNATLQRSGGVARLMNHGSLRPHASVIQWALDNSGAVTLQGGTVDFQGGYTQTAGETSVPSGAHLRVSSGSLNLRGGSLKVTGTIFANIVDMSGGAVLEGSGSASANVVVNNGGTVSPGLSPGVLSVAGNYTQNAGGTMAIEIGGRTVRTQYDRLAVDGTATLDGALDVELINSFRPTLNNSFEILTASRGVSGMFAATNLPALGSDLGWEVRYAANSVSLHVVDMPAVPGDYNGNGRVEQADLDLVLLNWGNAFDVIPVAWERFRPTEGAVDQSELDAVLLNWGDTFAARTGIANVPEPPALVLAVAIVLSQCCMLSRRRKRLPRCTTGTS